MQPTRLRFFKIEQPLRRMTWADTIILISIIVLVYLGVQLAVSAPAVISGPEITLAPQALPYYALLSIRRMALAYVLSILFTLVYGRAATRSRFNERVLMPLLDILQSLPILSFLPVVLLSLTAILPQGVAVELAAVVLIFTSQAWNLTFAWYQSLITIPTELKEASATYRFNDWMRFKTLELPFAANNLLWNSIMSWAGGWFFLMAAETFTVGERDFRLPGLGSYLREAADQGNLAAVLWGIGTLVLVIVIMDQLVWRPLLAWADRFKIEMVGSETPPTSWFYEVLHTSRLMTFVRDKVWAKLIERVDTAMLRRYPMRDEPTETRSRVPTRVYVFGIVGGLALAYGIFRAADLLLTLPLDDWGQIVLGVGATFLRVAASLGLALLWTVPVGVAIGSNPRVAAFLQPVVQIAASIPATALFPVVLLVLLKLPAGLEIAAIALMLLGTQWYVLFNIISGASAIPQDMKYTTTMLQIRGWQRWKTLILPALFPYIITGAITAGGGAWNASIVAEYVNFGGENLHTVGIGSLISQATAKGDYALLLAATLVMMFSVVSINRLVWRRLYRLAAERYSME
jgi:NitT/TauT family transport system permease protein